MAPGPQWVPGREREGSIVSKRLLVALAALALVLAAMSPATGQGSPEVVDGGVTLLSQEQLAPAVDVDGDKLVSVIVKLESPSLASYDGGIAGLPATSPKGKAKLNPKSAAAKKYLQHLDREHGRFADDLARAIPGASVTQNFDVVIGGVAALVPLRDLDRLAGIGGVQGVFLDRLEQLDTEVSPGFIGADDLWNDLGGQQVAGEGVIVGVIDSGVWPEHDSFDDPDPFGNPYPAPPVVPGSNGFVGPTNPCDFGDGAFNPADAPFTCNNKLIGAYDFTATYKALVGLLPTEFDSARDSNGHGTHTASTSAGNGGVAASIFGVSRGIVSGIAPRAHVIMYKGCGEQGCFSSDTSAAVQQAILDGVDVMNYSISGGGDPYADAVSLAFLDAYNAGMLVNPSAGNSGPGADTVAHREPWTLTVGASTSDRHFISTVTLNADNGDTLTVTGASVTPGIGTATPVIFPPAGFEQCDANPATPTVADPFPANTFNGEIVVCDRGGFARVAKSANVAAGGAGGMLLANLVQQGLATDNHFIPSVHLENTEGDAVKTFMNTHTGVTGTFTQGVATPVQGDVMAPFSSRGGPGQTLGISKPDVTAPGVQILAGHTPLPENVNGGPPGELFQAIQGTSMSAPHSTGSAALVKAANPSWGPGAIKSALMMTAKTAGVFKEDGVTPADPFDHGSGRILPDPAADAAAVITETGANYLALEGSLWDANYPSLYVPVMPGLITVQRTLTDTTGKNGEWKLSVDAPADLKVTVPGSVLVPKNGGKAFSITVDAKDVPLGEVRHATLTLTKNNQPRKGQVLHFPITIVRQQAGVTIDKECTPDTIAKGETTTCTITLENTTFNDADVWVSDTVPQPLKLDTSSVVGGTTKGGKIVEFHGSLFAAAPPVVNAAVTPPSAFGYFPLSLFAIPPISASDESIANFGVPSFMYAGELWNTVGFVSNGYAVVGGGTGADVSFINSNFPNASPPNNVLAPFWTDLDPSAGGALRIGVLGAGGSLWTVLDWENVPNFGNGLPNDFQIWIGANGDATPGEEIFFVYGPNVSGGDGGFLTVGAENKFGNSGQAVYFDGAGAAPTTTNTTGYEVSVFSTPGAPGETHTITFDASGKTVGEWWNYAYMTSDRFAGTAVDGHHGEVTK